MPQSVRARRQGTANVVAFGNKLIVPLGRGMIYREIMLRFFGTMTWAAAASNAAATMGRADEWSAVSRIDLIANGTDVIRSFSGLQLMMLNRALYGGVKRLSTQMGDGATAGPAFDSTLIIPLWQPLSVKPMDTALDSRKLSDLRLEITIDANTAVNTAAANTAIAATIDVYSNESFGVDGEFSDCRIYPIQQVIAGANANQQVQLPVGPLYRGFLINTAAAAAVTAADAAASLTNVQLISGTTVFRDYNTTLLKHWQEMRLGWNRDRVQTVAATAPTNGLYLNMARNTNLAEDAWVWLDLVQDGYLGEGTDSYGFSELFLNCNIAAATTLTVIPVAIFPRRGADKAAA